MIDNLRHWDVLRKVDPAQTKPFQRAGGFKGTATKPIWTEKRLTEHFGPCGYGWGCDEPRFTLVPAGEEILVFCTVRAWYIDQHGEPPATLYGVGGDKVLVKQQSGLRTDDEAYKKAFTDALGNAFKHLGAGADVHMGLFEDSKYVASMKREFSDEGDAPAARPTVAPAPRPAQAATSTTASPGTSSTSRPSDPFTEQPFPGDLPSLSEAGDEFNTAIRKRINEAGLPSKIDAVIKANAGGLARLKEESETAYNDLIAHSNFVKTELLSRAA